MILYDKDVLSAAGVPEPRAGWTQDEFLATALALTSRQEDKVTRYGFVDPSNTTFAFIQSRAGSALNRSEARPNVNLTAPQVVEAVRWYTDLALTHGVMPHPGALGFREADVDYRGAIYHLVGYKQAGLWSDSTSSWLYHSYQANLGMAPLPVGVEPVSSFYSAQRGVIHAHSAHPEASWLWLDYLSRQYVPNSSQSQLFLPVRRSVAGLPAYRAQLMPEVSATVRYVLDHAGKGSSAGLDGPLYDAVQAVYQGAPVEEALADAQEAWLE